MSNLHYATALLVALVSVTYTLYRKWTWISIGYIQGPKPQSWLLGNMAEYYQSQAGVIDWKWQEEFGHVFRVKGYFGKDQLFISDPKALQYIHNNSYKFVKAPKVRREFMRPMTGRGLTFAEGNVHRRQRRVNTPAFGLSEIKAHVPLFAAYARKLVQKWDDIIDQRDSATVDVLSWISRATLDVIGEAAFDYTFGAMDDAENPLKKAFQGISLKTFGIPSKRGLITQGILEYLPRSLISIYVDWAPSLAFARNAERLSQRVARQLVQEKREALVQGKGRRDIMSLLVKANASEDKRSRLTDHEMYSMIQQTTMAGHETTSNTLAWTFYELARRTDIQSRIRLEVRLAFQTLHNRGETALTIKDFESMEYFTAFTKEIFRCYPAAIGSFRQANQNLVLPLSKPIVTSSGEEMTSLLVPKGTNVIVSINGFNRNMDVFGEDAQVFNPKRWLNGNVNTDSTSVGAYSNLATFGGGLRACLGWRFALLEQQTFVAEILDKLAFSFPNEVKATDLRREACALMVPTLEGRVQEGPQMPLSVSRAPASDDK